mmetsp:Transcript_115489/g.331489  ORF Transcript_115489/g.331489 Transcript_115489/m.331489 type:complete len:273 (-) Transcript_115489:447-1265(-)
MDPPHDLPELRHAGWGHVHHPLCLVLGDGVKAVLHGAEALTDLHLRGLRQLDQPLEEVRRLPVICQALLPHLVEVPDRLLLPEALLRGDDDGHAAGGLVLVQRRLEVDVRHVHALRDVVQLQDQLPEVLHHEVPALPPTPSGHIVHASVREVRQPVLEALDAVEKLCGEILHIAYSHAHLAGDQVRRRSRRVVLDVPPQVLEGLALAIPQLELLEREPRLVRRYRAMRQPLDLLLMVPGLVERHELAQRPHDHAAHEQDLVDFEEALAHEVE